MIGVKVILIVHFTDSAPFVKGFGHETEASDKLDEIMERFKLTEKEVVIPGVGRKYIYAYNKEDLSTQAYIVDGSTFFRGQYEKEEGAK